MCESDTRARRRQAIITRLNAGMVSRSWNEPANIAAREGFLCEMSVSEILDWTQDELDEAWTWFLIGYNRAVLRHVGE